MAAEKALKAVVARSGIDPQWTHDLVRLAQQARVRAELAVNGADLRLLTDAHIQAQYPDPLAPAYTADEALHLLDIASAIVAVAQRALAT
jgi:HEPN domain-containing protein